MELMPDKKIARKCLNCKKYLSWLESGKETDYACQRRIMTNTEFMCNVPSQILPVEKR